MINILIVEDNAHKLETVLRLLRDDLLIEDKFLSSASDIKSAKRLLMHNFYDLLILDLVLPIEKDDEASPEKGIRFLNDINSNDRLNSPIHIIGLTERDDLTQQFDQIFHSYLWHLINYKASEANWQDKLKNLINHLISTRNSFFDKHQKEIECDIAIITALNTPEFDSVLNLSQNWKIIEFPGDAVRYHSTSFEKGEKKIKIIAACTDQMGMTATASLTTKICLIFKPNYIFMAGICAGLKERELNFGDVLIAEQSWDYGSGKMKEIVHDGTVQDMKFEPDPRPIPLCPELKAKVNNFLRKDTIRLKIQSDWKGGNKSTFVLQAKLGPVASGSYVISSDNILQEIKSHQRKLLGVEMEAYGLYHAAENSPYQFTKPIMIKSVSDFGDSAKNDGYQEYAAYTSSRFIYEFIMEEFF
jgi:nucleoside phosphorylase/CheY-like chemotaxis protein